MVILAVGIPGMVPALVGLVCRHSYPIDAGALCDPTDVWQCPVCGAEWADTRTDDRGDR